AMIGPKGEYIKFVRRLTGTKIHFDDAPMKSSGVREQTLHIRGPLLSVYRAHVVMMKRYHDDEDAQPAGKGGGKNSGRDIVQPPPVSMRPAGKGGGKNSGKDIVQP
ncbi:unnamed protein product, partial [Polarella glacialis]